MKIEDCSCKNTKQGNFHSSVKKKSVCCHPTFHLDSKRAPDSHLTTVIMEQLKGHLSCNLTHAEDSKFGRLHSSRDQEQSLSSLSHPFNRDKNSSDQKLHVMAIQGLDEEMVTQHPGPNR